MPKSIKITLLLIIVFIFATYYILQEYLKQGIVKYEYFTMSFPHNKKSLYAFSTHSVYNIIKGKKKIRIELDNDRLTNQKKINLIQYEARKLKYTMDTTTVIIASLTKDVLYSEIMQLIRLCKNDSHKRYALVDNNFIILGEYPKEPIDSTKKVEMIYL